MCSGRKRNASKRATSCSSLSLQKLFKLLHGCAGNHHEPVTADISSGVDRTDPADASTDLVLTVAAVARRLGVAPATLRTWARRYGLGPSAHVSGTHRRYTEGDLQRLRAMRRLTLSGMPAADAARAVLESHVEPEEPAARKAGPGGPGGRVIALPGGHPGQRGLAAAAMALDAVGVARIVRESIDEHGSIQTWDELVRPVLAAIGRRWEATGEGVEVEHLVSYAVDAVFRHVAVQVPEPAHGRPLLLASAPGELHHLPLAALAAALAEHGTAARPLGAATPVGALVAAVRRTGPSALLLWSQSPATADTSVLAAVPATRPPVSIITAGPGWDPDALPARVGHATSLTDAVRLLLRAAAP
jgi:DNA-binding transcriptional MerR regulator